MLMYLKNLKTAVEKRDRVKNLYLIFQSNVPLAVNVFYFIFVSHYVLCIVFCLFGRYSYFTVHFNWMLLLERHIVHGCKYKNQYSIKWNASKYPKIPKWMSGKASEGVNDRMDMYDSLNMNYGAKDRKHNP